ncbi:helix-hairpin-helix domain-containing protein [Saccharicrinis fermentans]|uniref:ComEA protein n=1 Tax=Saccharicrinis fermentans DSM 9555 = JCM 21142 TaxID=869213 RepID=W7YLA9_9BACT|nr:helix-hairpin-helix domain-containing protein [Saccharicrinis fermentans]GAF03124.1 ComEA protein [Saccharicrinis fermentans DSM 9555 = JCM 21142]
MWNGFFLYTRSEQKGIVVLLSLILIVLGVRFSMPYWMRYLVSEEFDEAFLQKVQAVNEQVNNEGYQEKDDSLFFFNPNTISSEGLLALGFNTYQAKSLIRYRNKIGPIRDKEDMLQVYGMDSSTYFSIEDFIIWPDNLVRNDSEMPGNMKPSQKMEWVNFNRQDDDFWQKNVHSGPIRQEIQRLLQTHYISKSLPYTKVKNYNDEYLLRWLRNNSSPKTKFHFKKEAAALPVVELNSADTSQLKQLRGIGSKLSVRIVKFRNSLGGFYCKSQLGEVYGISEDLYKSLVKHISVDTTLVKKIKPGQLKIEEISKHAYINYEQAKELKNLYRKISQPHKEDVLKLESIEERDWEKIKFYLDGS